MRLIGLASLVTGLASLPLVSCDPTPKAPHVQLQNGTLSGAYSSEFQQDFFLGVPYAEAPLGSLRFAEPKPPKPWTGVRKADRYGDWCIGNSLGLAGFSQNITGSMSEDCLDINIIRPAGLPKHTKLPILAWIHGGAWQEGSANDPRYNGSFLVQQSMKMGTPIVFVSFNYRLGLFGLLSGQTIEKTGASNLLLHDQRQALRWVQENIGAFNGNPSSVTIMGESSGAGSIGFHLLAYGGRDDGLFHAAISESGGPFSVYPFANASQRDADFASVLEATNCRNASDALVCLRSAPASDIQKASLMVQPYFRVDGNLIPERSSLLLQAGRFIKVPLLIGVNRNEGTSFFNPAISGAQNTDDDFLGLMRGTVGDHNVPDSVYQEWLSAYTNATSLNSPAGLGTVLANPGSEYGSGYGRATLWTGDFLLGAGRRYASQVWAANRVPSYSFFFEVVPSSLDPDTIGVAHAQEIPYVFANKNGAGWEKDPFPSDRVLRAKYLKLVDVMSQMWISFAVAKNPNHRGQSHCTA